MKEQALHVVRRLQDAGYQAVFAGGAVRDQLLGIPCHDIDVATNASPDAVEALFSHTVAVGKAFGVIVVLLDGVEIEVATFRSDGDYSDGRRPDSVTFTTMEDDARRRDLTINGLFFDPIKEQYYDFVGGQEDLKQGLIRLIGDPDQRIAEDRLRMLRVIRFASRFNFPIEKGTLEAVARHAPSILKVSAERIADEFLKILRTRRFRMALDLLFQTGLISKILPEVMTMKGCEQPVDYHPEGDVLTHTILALEATPEDASDTLLMAVLLHDVGKPPTQTFEDRIRFNQHEIRGQHMTEKILQRFKFSNEFIERVTALVGNHMKFMHVKDMRISRLKRFMTMPYFEEHMALHRVDCLSSHGALDNYEFVQKRLGAYEPEELKPPRIITGHDLIALGYAQGRELGEVLAEIEEKQLEGEILTHEQAMEFAKNRSIQ